MRRSTASTCAGVETRPTRDVREFLLSGDPAPEAVTLYGGDREAAAVADDLLQRGSRVVLVCPQHQFAQDVGRRAKILLLPRLAEAERLTTHLAATIVRVEAEKLLVRDESGERWVDAPGGLLISHGIEPRTALLDRLRALAPRLGVHTVGDASGDGGSVHAALASAVAVAAQITHRAEILVAAP